VGREDAFVETPKTRYAKSADGTYIAYQVLGTSSTVRDLTAGSRHSFEDAGEHELKGVPDRWRLYRVVGS
jgi:class 3 adenylate cyclase